MNELSLVAPKTGRVFVAGTQPPDKADRVLFALHGYGQLPQFFLRHLQPVVDAGWTVVAPEGLHRFYVEGTSGRVGASWMTKEARETDISDTVAWLDHVRASVMGEHQPKRCVLLGFSQGVAAAMRWAVLSQTPPRWDALIFWAGVLPHDLPWGQGFGRLAEIPIMTALGEEDPFFQDALVNDTSELLKTAELSFAHHSYPGGHRVEGQLLLRLLENLS